VEGIPTYFMTLKDAEGLIKQYAFVSVENYSIVGTGETVAAASAEYSQNLRASGTDVVVDQQSLQTKSGLVDRIAWEFEGTETVYRLTLQGDAATIYELSASVSDQLVLTQPGDRVELKFVPAEEETQNCTEFTNLSMR